MSNEEEDYFIEDLSIVPKKRIKSGRKGKNGERQIVKIFNERFAEILSQNPSWGCFSRSVGSGNRYSQTNLSDYANELYSGDIFCENFKFVVESKIGYDIDFITAFEGNKEIDKFLQQVKQDSDRCKKQPMLIWKKDRKSPIVFLQNFTDIEKFEYKMHYRDWIILSLDEFLIKMTDNFFFSI